MSFRGSKSLHQLAVAITAVCCFACVQSVKAQGVTSNIGDEPSALNFEDRNGIRSNQIGLASKHALPIHRSRHRSRHLAGSGIVRASWQYSNLATLVNSPSNNATRQSAGTVLQPQFIPTVPHQTHTVLTPQFVPAPVIVAASSQHVAKDSPYAMACDCQRSNCRKCQSLVDVVELARPDISNREHPNGGMSPRYPYETERFYYYQRPYNSQHVSKKIESVINGPTQHTATRPYSNGVAEALNKQGERNLAASGPDLVEDGFLEYVDWRDHQAARVEWEANQPAPSNQNARYSPPPRRLRLSR